METIENRLLEMDISEWEKFKADIDIKIKNKSILKPIQVLMERDTVYIFYKDSKSVCAEMVKLYKEENESDENLTPFHFWCEEPSVESYKFMGKEYLCINLWYDRQDDIAEEVFQKLSNLIK